MAVGHKLLYLREVGDTLDWKALAAHLWHPSPLGVLVVGCAWSMTAHVLKRRRLRRGTAASAVVEVPIATKDMVHVNETLSDTPANVADIIKVLKPGDSCEITEELVRKRTITLHAGQR